MGSGQGSVFRLKGSENSGSGGGEERCGWPWESRVLTGRSWLSEAKRRASNPRCVLGAEGALRSWVDIMTMRQFNDLFRLARATWRKLAQNLVWVAGCNPLPGRAC
jgi:hypothetical protein